MTVVKRDKEAKIINDYFNSSAEVKKNVIKMCTADILAAVDLIEEAFVKQKKLLLCGNGGSAADCQHLAAEFINRLSSDVTRQSLPAIALTVDSSIITSIANDYDFDRIFERQVEGLGSQDDILFVITTSGSSINIIKAVEQAQKNSMKTIALIGQSDKSVRLTQLADITITIPSTKTQWIQESHLAVEHMLCQLVEKRIISK